MLCWKPDGEMRGLDALYLAVASRMRRNVSAEARVVKRW